jgi:protein-S-isoprenylcysteine O-methyltransferase Ste14
MMRALLASFNAEDTVKKAPVVIAVALGVFTFLFGESSWRNGGTVHEGIEIFGIGLIVIHAVGRSWCWRYAHPKDPSGFTTTGPYSICRNPQDLFLLIGGIGIAAQLGSLTYTFAGALAVWGTVSLRVLEEERHLRGRFGDEFQAYRRRVPKFIPNLSLWQAPDPALFQKTSLVIGVLKAWPLGLAVLAAEVIERLHDADIVPVLFRLP